MAESMTVAVVVDLPNCCRVCLEQPHRTQMLDMNLIYDAEAQYTYYDCYEICTKQSLRDCSDNEPHSLCKHCGVELQWAYDFHKKVALASQQLKNMQSKEIEHRVETEKDEAYTNEEEQQMLVEILGESDKLEEIFEIVELAEPSSSESNIPYSSPTNVYKNVNDVVPRKRYTGKFSCNYCNKLFHNHSHMMKHQQIHLTDRPQYECNVCDRLYLTRQALKVHINTQHNSLGSGCPICGKIFAIAKGLEIHMRYHKNDFPFYCDQCDRKFAQRSHLTVHQKVQHSNARFLCEFPSCGKMFTSSSSLRSHECKHTEMPFECNVCQKGFPARHKLRMHAQRKHNIELTLEQLETMRKFHVMRSKRVLAKIDDTQQRQQPQQEEGGVEEHGEGVTANC